MEPEEFAKEVQKELKKELKKLHRQREAVSRRFPLPFALLIATGAVCTWVGISRLVDKVDYLHRNPILLVVVGVTILIITGSIYRKLN